MDDILVTSWNDEEHLQKPQCCFWKHQPSWISNQTCQVRFFPRVSWVSWTYHEQRRHPRLWEKSQSNHTTSHCLAFLDTLKAFLRWLPADSRDGWSSFQHMHTKEHGNVDCLLDFHKKLILNLKNSYSWVSDQLNTRGAYHCLQIGWGRRKRKNDRLSKVLLKTH